MFRSGYNNLKPGVISIPEGIKHWHGAANKDSWMQHLACHKDIQEGASDYQYSDTIVC